MPVGPRIRANNVYGTVSDNPLLIGAVSFTSLGLSLLPAISGQHAVIVLDPKRVFGEPEIVVVTSHLAMGTTATITRGTYGTAAREHPQGTAWAHVPVDEDYTEIVTSGTRPTDPYAGQMIFETDTNRVVVRDAGNTVWNRTAWTAAAGRTGVSLRRVANQSIPDAIETVISWDTEDFDSDGFITVPATTITVPAGVGGLYAVTARGIVGNPSVGSYSYLQAGGSTYLTSADPVGGADGFLMVSVTVPLLATNTVTYTVYQDHTGAANFTGSLHMYRIGP